MREEIKPCRKRFVSLRAIMVGTETRRIKRHKTSSEKYIEVCLNCTEKKCRGDCKKVHGRKNK